jgi:FkbM family methyltransferase
MKNFCYIAGQFGDGEIINANFDKILSVFQTLEDQLSKDIFSTFLRFNLTFKLNFTEYYDTETYFPLYLENLIDYSHFVDAGAFTGDTLKTWINHFKPQESRSLFSYFAIEPSSEHFNELKEYIDSLPIEVRNKISVEKCAAGSTEEILSLTGTGVTANLHSTLGPRELKEYVSVKKIDNLLSEQKPTIIKADVEGFEMALLEGARSTIKRYHPTLAISVYHNCYDIWEIPIWILNLDCGYKFYIRHHKPTYGDTVCYAIAR